jgi:hypothetical protein
MDSGGAGAKIIVYIVLLFVSAFLIYASIYAFSFLHQVFNHSIYPVLNWIDTVPFDGTIPIAASWEGWFVVTLFAIVPTLWLLKVLLFRLYNVFPASSGDELNDT